MKKIISPISRCDAIAPACTHNPAISGEIRKYTRDDCVLRDPAREMAEWISKTWPHGGTAAGDRWFTTGDASRFVESGHTAFGVDITDVKKLDVGAI